MFRQSFGLASVLAGLPLWTAAALAQGSDEVGRYVDSAPAPEQPLNLNLNLGPLSENAVARSDEVGNGDRYLRKKSPYVDWSKRSDSGKWTRTPIVGGRRQDGTAGESDFAQPLGMKWQRHFCRWKTSPRQAPGLTGTLRGDIPSRRPRMS